MIYEHICGGGLAGGALPDELTRQGQAMWRSVVADFRAAGAEVATTIDARLDHSIDVAELRSIDDATKLPEVFDAMAADADAVLVIAPEFDRILERWLARVEGLGVRNLGCTADAAALCADKFAFAKRLERAGVLTPPTRLAECGTLTRPIAGPTVVKPRFGAGCEQTTVVDRFSANRADEKFIAQPWLDGLAVSASFLLHGDQPPMKVTPLLAGKQFVRFTDDRLPRGGIRTVQYQGGALPLEASLAGRALTLARTAIDAVPGLRGFVGVDLILGDSPSGDAVIEINPRVTMSYVGLRELCRDNLAAAMVDADARITWRPGAVTFDSDGVVKKVRTEFNER